MSKCDFSDSLKFAEVSSLFKKKDTLINTNYRPVRILMAWSKICEKAVGAQLTGYFNSIVTILLNTIGNMKRALDKGEHVACISMDISKDFDCLRHGLTICKLVAYGLSKVTCTLISSN